jgi:ribonuclease BN (tRNA processing enzyme)
MTVHLLAAYREDIRERLEGLEPANPTGYRVNVHEITPGVVYQDARVQVEAFAVQHGTWPAYGFKFHAPDRTIVISGDTAPTPACVAAYRGCDVLVHEVYSSLGFAAREPDWQRYHASVHTSAQALAEMATQAQPGLLILYHQLFHGVSEETLLQEVRDAYAGPVVSGKDLEVY